MRAEDVVRIWHMIEAAESALSFARGRMRLDLDTDKMLQFALVQAVQVVGEAASKVSAKARAELPSVPWAVIVGMRNRLVHAYFEINQNVLWTTVQQALPDLLAQLKSLRLPE